MDFPYSLGLDFEKQKEFEETRDLIERYLERIEKDYMTTLTRDDIMSILEDIIAEYQAEIKKDFL